MNYGYVYKTICLLNNKIYIGQRKGDFDREYLGSGLLIQRAIHKYGKDNFAVMILAQALDKKSLDILERYYIEFYKQQLPIELIYNIAQGGMGGAFYDVPPMLGRHHSQETKKKLSQANRGRKFPPAFCKQKSESQLGAKNHNYKRLVSKEEINKLHKACKIKYPNGPMFGKHHSEETKNKQRISRLGIKRQPFSQEWKDKISSSLKGRKPWNVGLFGYKRGHYVSHFNKV
jgi:group I intron endonuclease